jgi:hypothetical protein
MTIVNASGGSQGLCAPAAAGSLRGGSIIAAVFLTMTLAGAKAMRPVQAVVDTGGGPELAAPHRHLERTGAVVSYSLLY